MMRISSAEGDGLLLHASRGSQGCRRLLDGNAQICRQRGDGKRTNTLEGEMAKAIKANTGLGMLVLRQPREVRQMVDEAGRLGARH
jgi:hypothetical protein